MADAHPTEPKDTKANLRAALGCGQYERTVDAARRVVAERDALRTEIEALRSVVRELWGEREEEREHAAE